jgi:chorismate mutase
MKDLQQLRDSLDTIDTALICLLAERFKLTHEVGLYKKERRLPPIDKQREQIQFERITQKAIESGLDPEFARKFLRTIIDEVVKNHQALQNLNNQPNS